MNKISLFPRRVIICFIAFLLLMFFCVLRLYNLSGENTKIASSVTNGYTIALGKSRRTVFDCNLKSITNNTFKTYAAFSPTPEGVTAAGALLSGERLNDVLKNLQAGKPATAEIEKSAEEYRGVYFYEYPLSKADIVASQLIGYTNAESHGVCGIESAFDSELYTENTNKLIFPTDGQGRFLQGTSIEFICDNSAYTSGIMLTINSDFQAAVEEALSALNCGAAILEEVGTGEIKAMASAPHFNIADIESALTNENSPMINRALSAYNVGSVFKPCIAAAVLEDGRFANYTCNCTGRTTIDGHTFKCHNLAGHGNVNLMDALCFSCNSFFYNISQKIGGEIIYKTAKTLGFGNSVNIGGIETARGNITALEKLKSNKTAVANLAIGQGELLASPVNLLPLYEAVANDGKYRLPTVIKGRVESGKLKADSPAPVTQAFSAETAAKLKEYLFGVINSGTGKKARPENVTAAGKTATAQTGWIKNGKKVQNSWFCGFFPYENPKYVAIILAETNEENPEAAAPVFAKIADSITAIETIQNSMKN